MVLLNYMTGDKRRGRRIALMIVAVLALLYPTGYAGLRMTGVYYLDEGCFGVDVEGHTLWPIDRAYAPVKTAENRLRNHSRFRTVSLTD